MKTMREEFQVGQVYIKAQRSHQQGNQNAVAMSNNG